MKRVIKGTYVSVEPYHLFGYLEEQAFRFNERDGKDADRFAKTLGSVHYKGNPAIVKKKGRDQFGHGPPSASN